MKIIIVIKHENTEIFLENQVESIFFIVEDTIRINIDESVRKEKERQTIDSINYGFIKAVVDDYILEVDPSV